MNKCIDINGGMYAPKIDGHVAKQSFPGEFTIRFTTYFTFWINIRLTRLFNIEESVFTSITIPEALLPTSYLRPPCPCKFLGQ